MDRTVFRRFAVRRLALCRSGFAASALTAVVLCLACGPTPEEVANGEDPLRALESSVVSTKYDAAYWAGEAGSGSALWTEALEKCADAKWNAAPNCGVIREQQALAEAEGEEDPVGDEIPEEVAPDDLGDGAAPDGEPEPDDEREAPSGTTEDPQPEPSRGERGPS